MLRAGDSQCGALPAAAEAARRAGAAQALASDRHMTPTSSAASTASTVHLRQGGFSDDSLASLRWAELRPGSLGV